MAINFQNVNISLSQFHEVARHGGPDPRRVRAAKGRWKMIYYRAWKTLSSSDRDRRG